MEPKTVEIKFAMESEEHYHISPQTAWIKVNDLGGVNEIETLDGTLVSYLENTYRHTEEQASDIFSRFAVEIEDALYDFVEYGNDGDVDAENKALHELISNLEFRDVGSGYHTLVIYEVEVA